MGITVILITHTDSLENMSYTHILDMSLDLTTTVSCRVDLEGDDDL